MSSVGSRLKYLRMENDFSQRQVAQYLEIDQSNLSKIENDKRNFSVTLLDKICNLYNCTPEFLLGENDVYEKPKIHFKSGKNVDLNVISNVNQIHNDLKILRKFYSQEPLRDLPKLNVNLKRKWGLDEYCPINVSNLLIQKIQNLTILWFPMERSVSGCCFKTEEDSIILVNSSHSKGRQNFTMAHELYHLLDDGGDYFICSDEYKDTVEEKADEFASNLIMSPLALNDFIESNGIDEWTWEDVVKCEQYFQLDHNILIHRLVHEKLIDGAQFAVFSLNYIDKACRLGYDSSLYEPNASDKIYYSLGHMIPLIERACDDEYISYGRKREMLIDIFREDLIYNNLRE